MLGMMGAFAEFERAMPAGLTSELGTWLGRPLVDGKKEEVIGQARANGKAIRRLARDLRVGVGTVLKRVIS